VEREWFTFSGSELAVKTGNDIGRRPVIEAPQAGDDSAGTSGGKGAAQPENTFPFGQRTDITTAGGEDYQVGIQL
jgi:hypothetical protein